MSFTIVLVLGGISFRLYFDKINTSKGIKFFVFAEDRSGNRYSFNMEDFGDQWRIVNAPKVSDIFIQNEKQLSDAIILNFKNLSS